MKKLLFLLLAIFMALNVSAQWHQVVGVPQINTSNSNIRWNFGPNGVFSMVKTVDTTRTTGGATFDQNTGILSIPRATGYVKYTDTAGMLSGLLHLNRTSPQVIKSRVTIDSNLLVINNIQANGNLSTIGTFNVAGISSFGGFAEFYGGIQSPNDLIFNNSTNVNMSWHGANGQETSGNASLKFSYGDNATGIKFVGNNIIDYAGNTFLKSGSGAYASTVFGRSGAVVAVSGDYNTSLVTESGNLYFTNARAIAAPLTGYTAGAGTVSSSDNILQALQKTGGNIANNTASITANNTAIGLRAFGLVPTAVKTANYTAAANDFVPVNTTSGAITITLPSAPADKTVVGVKMVIQGGTNATTINTAGSDVFNKAGGSTTASLSMANQGFWFQYSASGGIWYVLSDDLPVSALDLRYGTLAQQNTNTANIETNTTAIGLKANSANANLTGTTTLSAVTLNGNITEGTTNTHDIGATGNVFHGIYTNVAQITNGTFGDATYGFGVTSGSTTGFYIQGSTSGSLIGVRASPTTGGWTFYLPVSSGADGTVLTSHGNANPQTWTDLTNYAFGAPTVITPATSDSSKKAVNSEWVKMYSATQAQYFVSGLLSHTGSAADPFQLAAGAVSMTALNASGTPNSTTYLRGDGTWATVSSGFSNPMTTLGDIIYGGASGAATRLAGNTASSTLFLSSTGSGSAATAPSYFDLFGSANTFTGLNTFSLTNTASSGTTNYGFKLLPIGNQTSTAGFTDFFLNSTGTFGSGTHNLMDLWYLGVAKYTVSNTGFVSSPSGFGFGGSSNINTFSTSGTNSVDALLYANTAPSASGTPSLNSNRTRFMASGWNSTTSHADYTHIINELRATTGAAPTASMYWAFNLSTSQTPGTFGDILRLESNGNLDLYGLLKPKSYTVSTLPTASSSTGAFAYVTDASSPANGSAVASGGSSFATVISNGTSWIVAVH